MIPPRERYTLFSFTMSLAFLPTRLHTASEMHPSNESWNVAAEIYQFKMLITEVRL